MLQLSMRSFLDDDHPALLAERSHQFPAGDPGQWRHGANRRRTLRQPAGAVGHIAKRRTSGALRQN